MKNIFLILIVSLSFTFCKAQVPSSAPIISIGNMNESNTSLANTGTYYKDVENKYDQWVGTWQYQNGNTTFKIVIQKILGKFIPKGKYNSPINCYMDILVGGYYYEENGIIKTNQLIYSDLLFPPLFCYVSKGINSNLLISYREIEKAPNLHGWFVDFALLPGSTTQATWTFDSSRKRNYSVPDNVILTKL